MTKFHSPQYPFFIFLLTHVIFLLCGAIDDNRKVHIVYMGSIPEEIEYSPSSHHISILEDVIDEGVGMKHLVRSYTRSFNGFAAKLTDKEAQKLESAEGVLSVFPDPTLEFFTTRSWDFMGFHENAKRNPTVESDIIVGVIDSGIWPELDSFNDKGFGPPPEKWKGVCNGGRNFTCNNKIIGARAYSGLFSSGNARDKIGHGTHTASTAAGNIVKDVSFYGYGQGSARGGVPSARIAVYAVCTSGFGCSGSDVLAAFDDAIADGVDIITISMGGPFAFGIERDIIAIGSFHAMKKNILTSHAAGNSGPKPRSIVSVAPWLLSVAASSMDRRIVDKLVLGDGTTVIGNSINAFESTAMTPLVKGNPILCLFGKGSLIAKGNIVICNSRMGDVGSFKAGAVGSITKSELWNSFVTPFPASALNLQNFDIVKKYLNSTENPEGKILKSEVVNDTNAPLVSAFSSRGPNRIIPDILKPDITAPGVEILAAYSPKAPLTRAASDKRSAKYNILSGTSMSCPHATGAAAYVKSLHPDWSPSAIKSALMTSAKPMDPIKNKDLEFGYGAGHIDPVKAANPGLVYDASIDDYVTTLCSMGYSGRRLKLITGTRSCPTETTKTSSPRDLNYPSMAAKVRQNKPFQIKFNRTVTNVGAAKSIYKAKIVKDPKLDITVVPDKLVFKSLNEKLSFVVTVKGSVPARTVASSSLLWSAGSFNVRSPIVVYAR